MKLGISLKNPNPPYWEKLVEYLMILANKQLIDVVIFNTYSEGKYYKGNSGLKFSKEDHAFKIEGFQTSSSEDANDIREPMYQGASGMETFRCSFIDGEPPKICKSFPTNASKLSDTNRELRAMDLLGGLDNILVPTKILIEIYNFEFDTDVKVISLDDYGDNGANAMYLMIEECSPCKSKESSMIGCNKSWDKLSEMQWGNIDLSNPAMLNKFVREIGTGLKNMHSKKMYHKDIKPDNIVVCDGTWKLIDFGVSRSSEDIFSNGATMHFTNYSFSKQQRDNFAKQHGMTEDIYNARYDIYGFLTMILLIATNNKNGNNIVQYDKIINYIDGKVLPLDGRNTATNEVEFGSGKETALILKFQKWNNTKNQRTNLPSINAIITTINNIITTINNIISIPNKKVLNPSSLKPSNLRKRLRHKLNTFSKARKKTNRNRTNRKTNMKTNSKKTNSKKTYRKKTNMKK